MKRISRWILVIAICAVTGVAAKTYRSESSSKVEPAAVQDLFSLERRITSLEQRLYSIESSIRKLENQAMVPGRSAPALPSPEIGLVRTEVEGLKGRIAEVECGVVHIDERTLPASQRRSRGQPEDPCRLRPEMPVRLSTRP